MAVLAIVAALPWPLMADTSPADLTQMSLEDLMNVQVTSVSKKEQKLSQTAAAVFVITQEDIHRSGATNIPDLLRLAPGVDVAQVDANRWVITIRGFSQLYSDKVLVLIDGRSVYENVGSNVFWDDNSMPLEDIDRIEVIRGPGGTAWGANAVNGVINIISKSAKATKGGIVSAGGGSQETARGFAQYGASLGTGGGANGAYRVFGQYFNVDNSITPGGQKAADGWHGSQGGFRTDWDLSSRDSLTVQGEYTDTAGGQTVTAIFANALPLQAVVNDRQLNTAANLLGRWDHIYGNGSESSLQISTDYERRRSHTEVDALRQMTDVDFTHHISLGSRNDVVWGVGYRFEDDKLRPGIYTTVTPADSSDSLFSTFVQDEIKIANSLSLTVGSKFEHNGFTGFDYEPSAQLAWTPTTRQTVWASASRAVRQPSLVDFGLERDIAIVPMANGSFATLTLLGNPLTKNETLHDYEIGYRAQLTRSVSWDVTGFVSLYDKLVTQEPGAPFFTQSPGPPHLVLPLMWGNGADASNTGVEVFATWETTRRWRVRPGYSFLNMSISRDPTSLDMQVMGTERNSPKHQLQIGSWLSLTKKLDWDSTLMYVSSLGNLNVPSYVRLDTRLGWRLGEFMELSLVGQNLLRPGHQEFYDPQIHVTDVRRQVFGKITWRF
jgi:iron complex outermembrane receptor protein